MRKDFGAKAMLYPMPVLMISTYDESGNPDIMNAAWGGIADDTQINICLSPTHKTVKNIQAGSDFTVSMATAAAIVPCDFAGIVSAEIDFFAVRIMPLLLQDALFVTHVLPHALFPVLFPALSVLLCAKTAMVLSRVLFGRIFRLS